MSITKYDNKFAILYELCLERSLIRTHVKVKNQVRICIIVVELYWSVMLVSVQII